MGTPPNRGTRMSKSMAALVKPKVKAQGVWCHGTLLKIVRLRSTSTIGQLHRAGDSCQQKTFCREAKLNNKRHVYCTVVTKEKHRDPRTLSRTIQEVKDIFAQKGKELPDQLLVFAACSQNHVSLGFSMFGGGSGVLFSLPSAPEADNCVRGKQELANASLLELVDQLEKNEACLDQLRQSGSHPWSPLVTWICCCFLAHRTHALIDWNLLLQHRSQLRPTVWPPGYLL